MFSKGGGRSFSSRPHVISLDNAPPQFYNWTLKFFQQSCGAVNLKQENSYDDEHFMAA